MDPIPTPPANKEVKLSTPNKGSEPPKKDEEKINIKVPPQGALSSKSAVLNNNSAPKPDRNIKVDLNINGTAPSAPKPMPRPTESLKKEPASPPKEAPKPVSQPKETKPMASQAPKPISQPGLMNPAVSEAPKPAPKPIMPPKPMPRPIELPKKEEPKPIVQPQKTNPLASQVLKFSGQTAGNVSSPKESPRANFQSSINNTTQINDIPKLGNNKAFDSYKLAATEVQGPKGPLVGDQGRKLLFAVAGIVILAVLAISGYYLMNIGGSSVLVAPSSSLTPKPTIDPKLDSDNDGIPDKVEKAISTNPNRMDSDGDGYNDLPEIKNNYSAVIAGSAGKLTPDQLQDMKNKIKSADEKFYESVFGSSSANLSSSPSPTALLRMPSLSEDRKNIIADNKVLLTIEDEAIFNFFKTKSQLCDEDNMATASDRKIFCENKEIFKSKSRFASIVSSPDKMKIGFTIESDELSPDKVAGIFYPSHTDNKIYFLTNYYLGNGFISFSPNSINFVYQGNCWEGMCGLFIKNSETMVDKIDFNNPKEGVDARSVNSQFVKWISDNEVEYKLGTELKKVSF